VSALSCIVKCQRQLAEFATLDEEITAATIEA
jgi:hypothetical protein